MYSILFLEYLYRVAVGNTSGVLVPGKWIVVRSGEDGIQFLFPPTVFYEPFNFL